MRNSIGWISNSRKYIKVYNLAATLTVAPKDKNMSKISDELFSRFLYGDATLEEMAFVLDELKNDPQRMSEYVSFKRVSALVEEASRNQLPMEKMAAKSEDNLCDIKCERYILRIKFPQYGSQSLLGEARDEQAFLRQAEKFDEQAWIEANGKFFKNDLEKQWLTTQGVALYNVGRIMEGYGLSVTRQFGAGIEDIRHCIDLGEGVITIVNEETLAGAQSNGIPNHAVCVWDIDGENVRIYNPATDSEMDEYPLDTFLRAWATSQYYMVSANYVGDKTYVPHPIDVSEVELDSDLEDLVEAISENAHDVWAARRISHGYVYGQQTNEDLSHGPLTHKDLRPYSELPESEKDLDRDTAMNTLKLAKRLGFKVSRTNPDEAYKCPDCGEEIGLTMSFCPHCGRKLEYTDFIK